MGSSSDAKSELGKVGVIWAIATGIISVCLIVLSIPMWITVHMTVTENELTNTDTKVMLALNILSAIVLLLVAGCGFWGAIRYNNKVLDVFAFVNAGMFLILAIQLALTYVTWEDCRTGSNLLENSPFLYVCAQGFDDFWFWVPQLILLFINLAATCIGFSFGVKIKNVIDPPLDA